MSEKATGQPRVIVDYAHTPDALEKVLSALKSLEHHRLICVFGCGGDRDKLKRFLMGSVAARLADLLIVTDDNPRTEEPSMIRKAIIEGIEAETLGPCSSSWPESDRNYTRCYIDIGDRKRAIDYAVNRSGPDDIVLIAGKGHEAYQTIGTVNRFFDDCLSAQQAGLAWNLKSVAGATGGTIVQCAREHDFADVSTDTRTIADGDIFVALRGENFDGHEFIEQAVAKGARCLVVSDVNRLPKCDVSCVLVNDTLGALGDLAHDRLNRVRQVSYPVVIGLTGSCGKTTVKEMTAAIFNCRWPNRPDSRFPCCLFQSITGPLCSRWV
ncbi:MAG: cyanophycin synthetase [Desulfofustis sp.]